MIDAWLLRKIICLQKVVNVALTVVYEKRHRNLVSPANNRLARKDFRCRLFTLNEYPQFQSFAQFFHCGIIHFL